MFIPCHSHLWLGICIQQITCPDCFWQSIFNWIHSLHRYNLSVRAIKITSQDWSKNSKTMGEHLSLDRVVWTFSCLTNLTCSLVFNSSLQLNLYPLSFFELIETISSADHYTVFCLSSCGWCKINHIVPSSFGFWFWFFLEWGLMVGVKYHVQDLVYADNTMVLCRFFPPFCIFFQYMSIFMDYWSMSLFYLLIFFRIVQFDLYIYIYLRTPNLIYMLGKSCLYDMKLNWLKPFENLILFHVWIWTNIFNMSLVIKTFALLFKIESSNH